jgi:hypothetical protein
MLSQGESAIQWTALSSPCALDFLGDSELKASENVVEFHESIIS